MRWPDWAKRIDDCWNVNEASARETPSDSILGTAAKSAAAGLAKTTVSTTDRLRSVNELDIRSTAMLSSMLPLSRGDRYTSHSKIIVIYKVFFF